MLFQTHGVGNLTKDAEIKVTAEKTILVEVSLAASENVKNKDTGGYEDRPSYYTAQIWLPKESKLPQYLVKGQQIEVVGSLRQERWEKDGKKGSKEVIICQQGGIGLVGGKKATGATGAGDELPPEQDVNEDEIPF